MTLLQGLRIKMYPHSNKTFLRQNWEVRTRHCPCRHWISAARVLAVCAECERWFIYRVELKLCPVCCAGRCSPQCRLGQIYPHDFSIPSQNISSELIFHISLDLELATSSCILTTVDPSSPSALTISFSSCISKYAGAFLLFFKIREDLLSLHC